MSTVRKSVLVFATTGVAVHQWKNQIKQWTTLEEKYIRVFTSQYKDPIVTDACVVITTYSMVSYSGKDRAPKTQAVLDFIQNHQWGLIVLDEVQVAPARMFRRCVSNTHSFCKLGLTATLVREDNLIDDLYFLIGPKLYEANWLSLQQAGYIATVQCIEVWCPMTAPFYEAYLNTPSK